jgi:hypothetical protein
VRVLVDEAVEGRSSADLLDVEIGPDEAGIVRFVVGDALGRDAWLSEVPAALEGSPSFTAGRTSTWLGSLLLQFALYLVRMRRPPRAGDGAGQRDTPPYTNGHRARLTPRWHTTDLRPAGLRVAG